MEFTRISKSTARKMFNDGKEFWITACNMRPVNGVFIYSFTHNDFPTFEKLYNAFHYYNCDNERGRYPAYYIEQ